MAIITYLSIITLNVNGLHTPIKRSDRMDKKKQNPSISCMFTRDSFQPKDTSRLKVKAQKTICHENGSEKNARVAILISHKID